MPHGASAEDLLALVLQYAAMQARAQGERGEVWFTEEPSRLHGTIKDLRDRYKGFFPELSELSFSNEGAFPYSPELRQILGNLQLYGIIGRRNPSFDRFSPNVFEDTPEVLEQELRVYFEGAKDKRAAFDEMASELKDRLSAAA